MFVRGAVVAAAVGAVAATGAVVDVVVGDEVEVVVVVAAVDVLTLVLASAENAKPDTEASRASGKA